MKLKLTADKVLMRGPKADGSYQLTFEFGEYQKEKLAEILKLKTDDVVELTIEQGEDKSNG